MVESYARQKELRKDGGSRTVAQAAVDLRNLLAASAEVCEMTHRGFEAVVGTWRLDVPRACAENDWGSRLFLPFDVASITTLKPRSGSGLTFGTSLTEDTDFVATREDGDSNKPMVWLDRIGGSWPVGTLQLELTGVRGYSYEVEDTGLTVLNETEIAAGVTTLQVSSTEGVSLGETLKIESEQLRVMDLPSATNLTVARGVNGTTAAAHATGVAVYRRRYPRDIEKAVALRATDLMTGTRTNFSGAQGEEGLSTGTSFAQFKGLVKHFKRWGV